MYKNIVIFGASGDLAGRYLIPAVEKLKEMDPKIRLIGYGRSAPKWEKDIFVTGEYNQAGLVGLVSYYEAGTVYYVSLPIKPEILTDLIAGLKANKIFNKNDKLVLEKPFGTDFKSAKILADLLESEVDKEQLYLVDHYLSKDLVRNIVSLRFANPILQSIWKKDLIESIEIVAQEEVGVGSRGEYYDKSGATRDMVQNHLLQLLCLVCVNRPEEMSSEMFSQQKLAILNKIVVNSVKMGQYKGYREEEKVDRESKTETKVELELFVANTDWEGVPIKIITGKKMGAKKTYIKISFKKEKFCIWGDQCALLSANQLVISIYPEDEVQLTLNSGFDPHQVLPKAQTLKLSALTIGQTHEAYENVLSSIVAGDRLYTPTTEEILAQWKIVDEILAIYGGKVEEY